MFIARSIASKRPRTGKSAKAYKHMPTLSGKAKLLYEKAYGQETYKQYCDASDTFHGREKPKSVLQAPDFFHRPDHDVESIFWVLFLTLIRAQPCITSTEIDLRPYWKTDEIFRNHIIDDDDQSDTRDVLFDRDIGDIQAILDPQLAALSQMLVDMGEQIMPEYSYLYPPPARDHLHEAMRRLLLEQLAGMKDEIALQPGVPRPPRLPESPPQVVPDGLVMGAQQRP